MPAQDLDALRAFRTVLHHCAYRRADALFELVDALVSAEAVTSWPALSLQATHRRSWGSLYDALAEGRFDVAALQALLMHHAAPDAPRVYAVDLSVWPAATPRLVRIVASITIRPATPPASRSWPGGPISGWLSSASHEIAGRPHSMSAGCIPLRMPTWSRSC